jgi:transposase
MKTETTWVGIDVSSKELVVAWQRGTTPVRTGTFPNTPEGHATLLRAFTPHTPIQVVMEATGHWHLDLAWRLSQTKGLSVMVANPRATCNFAKARLQRAKTDAVDAASGPAGTGTGPAEKPAEG